VMHGSTSAVRSPVRRPARNVLFPSPQNVSASRAAICVSLSFFGGLAMVLY